MSDLISRAEALKYIPPEEPISRMVIAQLPTIESEPRWIPVTEKLPETDGIYLITDASCGYEDVRESFYYHNDVDYDDPYWDYNNVTAWMPFPEPYREVEE